jgi:Mlc titration factor MtfA (ptsG expression regulator)
MKSPATRKSLGKALAIPVLANLSDHEQQQLAQMASRFLQQKRLVALQGLELT